MGWIKKVTPSGKPYYVKEPICSCLYKKRVGRLAQQKKKEEQQRKEAEDK